MRCNKKIFIFQVLLIIVLLVSCGKKSEPQQAIQNVNPDSAFSPIQFYAKSHGQIFYPDYVIYFSDSNGDDSDNLYHYYDCNTDMDVVFCSKPECNHKNQKECFSAYLAEHALGNPIVIINDKLYYLGTGDGQKDDNPMHQYLYRSDIDGSNKETLTCYEYLFGNNNQMFSGDYFFLTYSNCEEIIKQKQPDGSEYVTLGDSLSKYESGIYLTNINSGEKKILFSKDDKYYISINLLFCDGNSLYFGMEYFEEDFYNDYEITDQDNYKRLIRRKVMKTNLSDGTTEEIKDLENVIPSKNSLGCIYYNELDDGKESLYRYDLFTGDKKMISEENAILCASNGVQSIVSLVSPDSTDKIFYLIDNKTGEKLKQVEFKNSEINGVSAYVGNNVYISVLTDEKRISDDSYLTVDDFFDGKSENIKKYAN